MNQPNWSERQQQLREDEWQLSREAFEVVRAQLTRLRHRPFDKVPIAHLIKLIELASTLGRRATGLPLESHAHQESVTWQPQQDEFSTPVTPDQRAEPPTLVTRAVRRGYFSRQSSAITDPRPANAVQDSGRPHLKRRPSSRRSPANPNPPIHPSLKRRNLKPKIQNPKFPSIPSISRKRSATTTALTSAIRASPP